MLFFIPQTWTVPQVHPLAHQLTGRLLPFVC